LEEKTLTLDISEKAIHAIAQQGYSPVYGARPLKRVLQKTLLDQLALKILDNTFQEGDSIYADLSEAGNVIMDKASLREAQ
jgi:ATP-dependent Clp protease ATP-binding subunit ClpB